MRSHLAPVWARVTDLDVVSGRGAVVVAADGTEFLDFTSGLGVTSTGHCHPAVVDAICRQAATFIHAQVNVYRHPLLERLATALAAVTPDGIDRFFFSNSGAEAVEAAVKLARQATRRPNLIVFEGGFHGRTAQTMAMTTTKTVFRAGHSPLPSGVHVAPFPFEITMGADPGAASQRCLAALDRVLASQTAPSETAAMVVEPVLGEGGYLPAPAEFVRGIAERCASHGIVLIADEIQSGAGRTGRWFAVGHIGVRPDVLVMGKGMASGFPIAAIGASDELMERWPAGSHGGTYGGNPMGCAAALATIEVIGAPGFLDEVGRKGVLLRSALESVRGDVVGLADIRGLGLMVGTELRTPDGRPDTERAAAVQRRCRDEHDVLLLTCGLDANTIRWIPPLVASDDQIVRATAAFAEAMHATADLARAG